MTLARLAGRVVTVGDAKFAPTPAARTWAVAARCSAALLGLDAVNADCWPSLGACIADAPHQHVSDAFPKPGAAAELILLPRNSTSSAIFGSFQECW